MLKIRLQRVGRIHEPSFRLVLTDSKNSSKSGRFAEVLGSYDPRKMVDSFNTERIKSLLSQGTALTPSVNNLLIKHRIITGKKIDVSATSKKAPQAAPVVAEAAPVAEAPEVVEEAPAPVEEVPVSAPETPADSSSADAS